MIAQFLIFLISSFFGWVIDSSFCSLIEHRFISSGYFRNVPLCPIYGFGGIFVINIFLNLEKLGPIVVIFFSTLTAILLEYFGGWFCKKYLGEKLWDYSNMPFNLHGNICLFHATCWFFLISLLFIGLHPHLPWIRDMIENLDITFSKYDSFLFIFIVPIVSVQTIYTKNSRYKMKLKD